MEPPGTFGSLGPKIGVGMRVRVDKVILRFPSFFLRRLSEISVEQFLHTKGSHNMLKCKDILDC